MKHAYLFLSAWCIIAFCSCSAVNDGETSGGWKKYEGNPVLGGDFGTIFDVSVLKTEGGVFQMFCSWRPQKSIALSESSDGLKWSSPVICLQNCDSTGWEDNVNRPVIIRKDGLYHMWYTGQADIDGTGHSWIGYAASDNGREWKRMSRNPVLSAEAEWEKVAVMCPHVIWDESEKIYKMWYSGGEQYEPDAIGYATSPDGMNWTKYEGNPVFSSDNRNKWEQHKVTACQVIKRKDDYLMLYIGFMNIDYAQIGMARSKDGISGWERYSRNPIIKPGKGWDSSAVYKPFAVQDNDRWLLYYNGRKNNVEQIGVAIRESNDPGF